MDSQQKQRYDPAAFNVHEALCQASDGQYSTIQYTDIATVTRINLTIYPSEKRIEFTVFHEGNIESGQKWGL